MFHYLLDLIRCETQDLAAANPLFAPRATGHHSWEPGGNHPWEQLCVWIGVGITNLTVFLPFLFPGAGWHSLQPFFQSAQESKSSRSIPPFLPPSAVLLNTSGHTAKPVINSWVGSSNDCRYLGFTCLHLRVCGRPLKAESVPFSWAGQVELWLHGFVAIPVLSHKLHSDSSTHSSSAAASTAPGSSSKALNPFSQAGSLHLKSCRSMLGVLLAVCPSQPALDGHRSFRGSSTGEESCGRLERLWWSHPP